MCIRDKYLLTDYVAGPTEGSLPETIGDQRHVWSTVAVFFRSEVATHRRLYSEGIDQPASYPCCSHTQRLAIGTNILSARCPCANSFPRLGFVLNIEEFRRRQPEFAQLHSWKFAVDAH